MKQFACGSVVEGCQAVFRAPTEEELLSELAVHACEKHGLDRIPEALVDTVRSHITDVPA